MMKPGFSVCIREDPSLAFLKDCREETVAGMRSGHCSQIRTIS